MTVYQSTDLTQRMENNSAGLPIYIGEAQAGASTGASVWRIKKLTYLNNIPISVTWANGSADFNKEWTLRDTYTYS